MKPILNKLFGLLVIVLFVGCKPYYSNTKVYYNSTNDLLDKSKRLDVTVPVDINFSGKISEKENAYKIVGTIKIFSESHLQMVIVSRNLGFEICRLDFRNDSMVFINKLNKSFYSGAINQFIYLNNLNFNANEIIRLFVGRNFLESELKRVNKSDTFFSYSFDQLNGTATIGGIGYNSRHTIEGNDFNTVINYSKYLRKHNVPTNCFGNFGFKGSSFDFTFNYNRVNKGSDTYKVFEKPKNYVHIQN